ncbi:MAG: 4a-hydroxytetrahydrobiopterin dehydratase [Flavobacteriia bacterium]|nr:4a-hydroxytetrahydrobiopterin dehydratase [Flavobacteriia bacterium]
MKHFLKVKDQLVAEFEFDEFSSAIRFVTQIAELAESENHHPDIDIRFTKITVKLTTHDAGSAVTEKDYSLAEKIEKAYS